MSCFWKKRFGKLCKWSLFHKSRRHRTSGTDTVWHLNLYIPPTQGSKSPKIPVKRVPTVQDNLAPGFPVTTGFRLLKLFSQEVVGVCQKFLWLWSHKWFRIGDEVPYHIDSRFIPHWSYTPPLVASMYREHKDGGSLTHHSLAAITNASTISVLTNRTNEKKIVIWMMWWDVMIRNSILKHAR